MLILITLRHEPLHGYAIAQQIQKNSDDLLRAEEGSLQASSPRARSAIRRFKATTRPSSLLSKA
jgi:Transcriptional regulator PadR-like family